MKKIIFVASFSIASLVSARNSGEFKRTNCEKEEIMIYYDPIIPITSSCGYTEYIDLGGSPISCLEVEINRMEEECDAPVTGWGYAYNGYS